MRGYITHPLAMTVTIQPHRCFIRLPFFYYMPRTLDRALQGFA